MEDKIITVQRKNVILKVREHEKPWYLQSGYSVVDEKGEVVEEGVIQDVHALQVENAKLKLEIAELELRIAELLEQVDDGKEAQPEKADSTENTETEQTAEQEEAEEDKPKRKSGKADK